MKRLLSSVLSFSSRATNVMFQVLSLTRPGIQCTRAHIRLAHCINSTPVCGVQLRGPSIQVLILPSGYAVQPINGGARRAEQQSSLVMGSNLWLHSIDVCKVYTLASHEPHPGVCSTPGKALPSERRIAASHANTYMDAGPLPEKHRPFISRKSKCFKSQIPPSYQLNTTP